MFSLAKNLNKEKLYFNFEHDCLLSGQEWQEEYADILGHFFEALNIKDFLKEEAFYEHAISGHVAKGKEWIKESGEWRGGYVIEDDVKVLIEVKQDENGVWERA